MKKIILMLVLLLSLTGCNLKKETDALKFKNEYESLNNELDFHDKETRDVTIPVDNPIVYSSYEEIVNKIDNKETFYVYFGFSNCPWCRSMIETLLSVAKEKNVDKIYYVDAYTSRDTFELDEKNKPVKTKDGETGYDEVLKRLDKLLSDYTLKTSDGKTVKTGEKRIYAPNVIYVENGEAKSLVAQSKKQKNAYDELTNEIILDMKNIYSDFFSQK